jgi:hypothetical protein
MFLEKLSPDATIRKFRTVQKELEENSVCRKFRHTAAMVKIIMMQLSPRGDNLRAF